MGSDAVSVLLDLVDAAASGNNEVAALLSLMEVADLRGGRGLAALTGNTELLRQSLAAANKEWATGTSLIDDYNRAMSSTKSQLAMLKNNITDAGITIGEALLPTINRLIQVAIPAIRMLAEAFKKLPKSTQMNIVAFAGLTLVLGPALMFFGQMLHAVTLVVLGLGKLAQVVIFAIGGIGKLGAALGAVGGFLSSWPVLILAAAVGVLKVLSMMGVDISGFFKGLASRAKTWGEKPGCQHCQRPAGRGCALYHQGDQHHRQPHRQLLRVALASQGGPAVHH